MRNLAILAMSTTLLTSLSACGSSSEPEPDTGVEEAAASEVESESAMDASDAVADVADEGDASVDGNNGDAADASDAAADEPAEEAATSADASTPEEQSVPDMVVSLEPPASFGTCMVCHSTDAGQNGIGPSLAGVVGRHAGSAPGANYSAAMRNADITWTQSNLRNYLVDPSSVVPGGTMPPPGVNADEARAIVEYLRTL